jgi:N-sulfoglucosamine sulfohydrolase
LDFAGALGNDGKSKAGVLNKLKSRTVTGEQRSRLAGGKFHGRSFIPILGGTSTKDWDEVYASHTFHEITMYYPMRVVRERRYKLIWNIAHDLPYPFASDLWRAPTWQAQYKQGMSAPYGKKTVRSYIHRAEFELYDIVNDPHEGKNLADSPVHQKSLERLKAKLKAFQKNTNDPWIMKWRYE